MFNGQRELIGASFPDFAFPVCSRSQWRTICVLERGMFKMPGGLGLGFGNGHGLVLQVNAAVPRDFAND
jgi:hypothetical protein